MSWRSGVITLAVLVGMALVGCGERAAVGDTAAAAAPDDSIAVPAEAADRARAVAAGMAGELQTRLFAALDSGGPPRAITVCADSAQAWTARHAREGVYVRRVSLRVRNPRNRPDSIETRELQRLDSLHRAGSLPGEVIRTARTATGERLVEYMRPIVVQERCLACHGERERLAPAVRSLLDERYPNDEATGYRAGDLRGMVSVRVPLRTTGGDR